MWMYMCLGMFLVWSHTYGKFLSFALKLEIKMLQLLESELKNRPVLSFSSRIYPEEESLFSISNTTAACLSAFPHFSLVEKSFLNNKTCGGGLVSSCSYKFCSTLNIPFAVLSPFTCTIWILDTHWIIKSFALLFCLFHCAAPSYFGVGVGVCSLIL